MGGYILLSLLLLCVRGYHGLVGLSIILSPPSHSARASVTNFYSSCMDITLPRSTLLSISPSLALRSSYHRTVKIQDFFMTLDSHILTKASDWSDAEDDTPCRQYFLASYPDPHRHHWIRYLVARGVRGHTNCMQAGAESSSRTDL
jgi:hypothetical protein